MNPDQNKPNFTVVLIARNEEKTLPRLVRSLRNFQLYGGKILVLDTGSTDQTANVAKDLGCKVEEVGDRFVIEIDKMMAQKINDKFCFKNGPFESLHCINCGALESAHMMKKVPCQNYVPRGEREPNIVEAGEKLFDFSSARNYIANLAETDWVWMPDCDEVFTTFNLDAIDEAVSQDDINRLEYEFVFSHDAQGKANLRFMHSKMYRKSSLEWVGVIHEVLQPIKGKKEGGSLYLPEEKVLLEHYQNVETNRNGYLKGLAVDCYLNPTSDRNSHYFGRELLWRGYPLSAIQELKRHIAMNSWQTERSESMIYIGHAMKITGQDPVEWYQKAYNIEPSRREPLVCLADYYFEQGLPQYVIAYMEAALTIPRGNFYANYTEHYTHKPHDLLYWAYWHMGNKEKSKEHYDIAVSYRPNDPKILFDRQFYYDLPTVTFVIPTLGREEGLEKCITSIGALIYPQEKIGIIVKDGEGTVPEKVNQAVKETDADLVCYAANDVVFTPESLMIAVRHISNGAALVAFNTGELLPDNGNICEHFLIDMRYCKSLHIDNIFDPEFHHVGVDNLLWAKIKFFGENRAVRAEDVIVIHNHFSRGGEMDDVYKKGWAHVDEDRALLKKKLAELEQ